MKIKTIAVFLFIFIIAAFVAYNVIKYSHLQKKHFYRETMMQLLNYQAYAKKEDVKARIFEAVDALSSYDNNDAPMLIDAYVVPSEEPEYGICALYYIDIENDMTGIIIQEYEEDNMLHNELYPIKSDYPEMGYKSPCLYFTWRPNDNHSINSDAWIIFTSSSIEEDELEILNLYYGNPLKYYKTYSPSLFITNPDKRTVFIQLVDANGGKSNKLRLEYRQ